MNISEDALLGLLCPSILKAIGCNYVSAALWKEADSLKMLSIHPFGGKSNFSNANVVWPGKKLSSWVPLLHGRCWSWPFLKTLPLDLRVFKCSEGVSTSVSHHHERRRHPQRRLWHERKRTWTAHSKGQGQPPSHRHLWPRFPSNSEAPGISLCPVQLPLMKSQQRESQTLSSAPEITNMKIISNDMTPGQQRLLWLNLQTPAQHYLSTGPVTLWPPRV